MTAGRVVSMLLVCVLDERRPLCCVARGVLERPGKWGGRPASMGAEPRRAQPSRVQRPGRGGADLVTGTMAAFLL